jgi:hypothetical protein
MAEAWFIVRAVHVKYMMSTVAMEQIFSACFVFILQVINPPVLNTHPSLQSGTVGSNSKGLGLTLLFVLVK